MDGYLAARDVLAETLRTYAGTFERLIVDLGGDRFLGDVGAEEPTGLLSWRWGTSAVGTYPGCTGALCWVRCRFTWKYPLSWDNAGVEDRMTTRTEGISQMRSPHTLTGIETTFDEGNLVAKAGLLAPGALAQKLGVAELVDAHLHLPTDAVGRAGGGTRAMTVIGAMLAGGDSIADIDTLRAGAGGELFDQGRAPSTIGTWLGGFTWASVRMLDRVSRRVLARAWQAGLGLGP